MWPRQASYVPEIARKTLGDSRRWPEIYRLNGTIDPSYPVPGGTDLRLPSSPWCQGRDAGAKRNTRRPSSGDLYGEELVPMSFPTGRGSKVSKVVSFSPRLQPMNDPHQQTCAKKKEKIVLRKTAVTNDRGRRDGHSLVH